jgi:hypothetical protein
MPNTDCSLTPVCRSYAQPVATRNPVASIGKGSLPLLKAFKGAILDPNNSDPGEERADECRS